MTANCVSHYEKSLMQNLYQLYLSNVFSQSINIYILIGSSKCPCFEPIPAPYICAFPFWIFPPSPSNSEASLQRHNDVWIRPPHSSCSSCNRRSDGRRKPQQRTRRKQCPQCPHDILLRPDRPRTRREQPLTSPLSATHPDDSFSWRDRKSSRHLTT